MTMKNYKLVYKPHQLYPSDLVLQIPSEKVFRPQKTTPNTVSEGVWICGDGYKYNRSHLFHSEYYK